MELDFENEGKNSERCQKDLKHLPYIYVPKVHWDKTSKVSNTGAFTHACLEIRSKFQIPYC